MARRTEQQAAADDAELIGIERIRRNRRQRQARRRAKRLAIAAAIVVGLGGSYLAGYLYYSDHLYGNTKVCGLDVSDLTHDSLKDALTTFRDDYVIAVAGDGLTFEAKGEDIDFTFDIEETADFVFSSQNTAGWPVAMFGSASRMPKISFDAKKLDAIVDKEVEAFNKAVRKNKGKDALSADSPLGLNAAAANRPIDAASVKQKVAAAVAGAKASVTLDASDLLEVDLAADVDQDKKEAKTLSTIQLALVRDGEPKVTLDYDTFKGWLDIKGDGSVGLTEDAVTLWLDEVAWQDLDYADKKTIYTVDAKSTAHDLSEALRRGVDADVEVTFKETPIYVDAKKPLTKATWDESLGRYIDVDKKAQVTTLFDDTGRVLFETIVTTGNEATNDGTPTGTFSIYDKVADTVLIGLDMNNDGEPDYEHHVDYWMPFTGYIAFHDADWRTTYGGDEYLERGSTGCVNIPKEAAGVLFNITHVSETVVVHD
jgi:lipoprotein-anchoring transpeptidase ErfK/SrfK